MDTLSAHLSAGPASFAQVPDEQVHPDRGLHGGDDCGEGATVDDRCPTENGTDEDEDGRGGDLHAASRAARAIVVDHALILAERDAARPPFRSAAVAPVIALDEIAERNARAHVLAAATGLGLSRAQEDVAALLDVLADVRRTASGAVERVAQLLRQRDTLVRELARARGCSEDVVRVGAGIKPARPDAYKAVAAYRAVQVEHGRGTDVGL